MPCRLLFLHENPVVIEKGEGSYLYDIDGSKYLDFFAGHAAAVFGHCHPKIVQAIKDQVEQLIFYSPDFYTLPAAFLAEKLAKMNKFNLTKSFFLNSGGEAVECAMHLARKHTKRHEVIGLWGAFHGRSYGSRSLTSWHKYKKGMGPYLPGITSMPSYYCYRCFLGLEYPDCGIQCARLLDDVLKFQTEGNVAAFIAEPVLGSFGNIPAPDGYFKQIKKILDEHDILFISDEVITGLGRTGKLFGIEHYGVRPDIITVSKTLGGGVPIGAVLAREDVANSFNEGDYFTTVGGNPLSCAAALAGLNIIEEEGLIDNSQRLGQRLLNSLMELKNKHQIIGDVRGKGLLVGVELVKDRTRKEPAVEEAAKLRVKAKEKGLILGAGMGWYRNCVRINPPLNTTGEEIDKAVQIMDEIFQKDLKK